MTKLSGTAGAVSGLIIGLIAASLPVVALADPIPNPPATITLGPAQGTPSPADTPFLGQLPGEQRFVPLAKPSDQSAEFLGQLPPNADPVPSTSNPLPTGARFVPLLKATDQTADTNNRGSFIEKHEFGIELRTPF